MMSIHCRIHSEYNMKTGTKVRLTSTGEVGIVVNSWHDPEVGAEDNHIAFFGMEFPAGKPDDPPYILRYFTSSLERVDDADCA